MSSSTRARAPAFCPNPHCDFHRDPTGWRYRKKGFYLRQATPRRIQRYLCRSCGRNFSSQTFSTTYWLRRPDLPRLLFHRVLACSALRQIAHELDASSSREGRDDLAIARLELLYPFPQDDVRELIEAVRYAPSPGKYRIYIVDEVHMLSTAAFNALLKTLEEPPPRSLFLFCTTNPG